MFDTEVFYEEVFTINERELIKENYSRLGDECYLDHTGCPLYPDSILKRYLEDLQKNLYGNPHSGSLSSKLCNDTVDQIRYKILQHFNTSSKDYSVIFTSGATASLKLVAESFLWRKKQHYENENIGKSYFVYMEDNHTSVLGMREVIKNSDAEIICLNHNEAIKRFNQADGKYNKINNSANNSLFVYSAQCNFSGVKYPLSWISKVHSGVLQNMTTDEGDWYCLLDAATYLSTNKLDLETVKPDFVTLSFYKMFGFPTGLGALLVRNSSAHLLEKKYYGGGTVFMALSEENTFVPRSVLHERFEDGTINFLSIIALRHGFNFWKNVVSLEKISKHCFHLAQYAYICLSRLHHYNGAPVAVIYADSPYDDIITQGGILNFNLLRSNGDFIGYSEVLNLANLHCIHLRTGCFCNPGACRRHLQLTSEDIKLQFTSGHVCGDDNDLINGQPTGSVRIAFGPYSTVDDVDKVLNMILNCFVQRPHLQKNPDRWILRNNQLKEKFQPTNNYNVSSEEMLKKMSFIYFWLENVSDFFEPSVSLNGKESSQIKSVEENKMSSLGNRQFEGVHLSHLFLYPVKSCGSFSVNSWELSATGLKYDRKWMITTQSGVALTQKTEPRLCIIKPIINLEMNKLILTFKGYPSFTLDLDDSYTSTNEAWLCSSKVCSDPIKGQDCGDSVSSWLSHVLKKDGLRLIKLCERDSKLSGSLSLTNQAQYLLINSASVEWLSNKLDESSDCSKESMLSRFRSNLVVSGLEKSFVEQSWKTVTIGQEVFEVIGPCGRCQMICIDQETGKKTKEPLTTLAASFKGKLKFGIYLTAVGDKQATLSLGDSVSFEV